MSMTKQRLYNGVTKGQGLTRVIVWIIAIYSYVAWPVEPPDHLQQTDLHQISGVPRFQETLTSKMSDTYFFVGDIRLSCSFGIVDGANGCAFFRDWINTKENVTATYYRMPTRLGSTYPMLYRLKQNGRVVVSPKMTSEQAKKSHISKWEFYFAFFGFLLLVFIAAVLIDRATIKHNRTLSRQEN